MRAIRSSTPRTPRNPRAFASATWGAPARRRISLAALVLAIGAATAVSQDGPPPQPAAPPDRGVISGATLPESNEAMLLTSQVEQSIRRGDFRLAIRLAERMAALPAELVIAPAGRTYYPVWQQANRLLEQLPPEGVEVYRQMYDGEVSARLAQAAGKADIDALRELFRRYRPSTDWPAVGRELASELLDLGEYGGAIEVIRAYSQTTEGRSIEASAQLVVALAGVGAWQAAQRELDLLDADPRVGGRPGWRDKVAELRRWTAARRLAVEGPLIGRSASFSPALSEGAIWRAALPAPPADPPRRFDDDTYIATAIEYARRLPLHQAMLDHGMLLLRVRGAVLAYDGPTLTLLWRESDGAVIDEKNRSDSGGDEQPISTDSRLLLTHALAHALSASFGQVYTVEAPLILLQNGGNFEPRRFREFGNLVAPNELVARDRESGKVAWRIGRDVAHPLYGVAFQDAPLAVGVSLLIPVQRGDDLLLCQLDPATGALQREAPVIGPPTYFTPAGGRALLAADETTVYLSTGNGVVAAVHARDLSWKWAWTYPSSVAERRAAGWWATKDAPRDYGAERPLVADELVIVAPTDAPYIFAIDRFNGRQRWRVDRGTYEFVVGPLPAGLVVGGNTLTCLDWSDGHSIRWRSVPLEITGRPAIRGERIYVPTREGLVSLDGQTGKALTEAGGFAAAARNEHGGRATADLAARDPVVANLITGDDALYAVSPNVVVKYGDAAALRAEADEHLGADPQSERWKLVLAWAHLLAGEADDALSLLDGLRTTEDRYSEARDLVLTGVFVALAREAGRGDAQLAWLRRAATVSTSPEVAARLSQLIGEALESNRRYPEALAHYRDELLRPAPTMLRGAGDDGRDVAAWLAAAARVRANLAEISPEDAGGYLDGLLDAAVATDDSNVLTRLASIALDATRAERWRREIALRLKSPELVELFLPTRTPPALPADVRRRLQLVRWDTHTALGMLDEARRDRDAWQDQFATSAPASAPADAGASGDAETIERIERSMAKQEQMSGEPFGETFRRQWATRQAELVTELRQPLHAIRPFLLARRSEDHTIELCSAERGKSWRQTPDAIGGGQAPRAVQRDEVERLLLGGRNVPLARRPVWPMVGYRHLAAVPTRGGLIGLGLGPERGGGKRLWEVAIPEWTEAPLNFEQVAVAGPAGVWFAPRPDRVMLIGWGDGQPWWTLRLPGFSVQQMERVGDELVLIGQDQQVLVVDAMFGDRVRRLPAVYATPLAVAVAADTLLIWTDEVLVALEPVGLRPLWAERINGIHGWAPVAGTTLVAYRTRDEDTWRVFDAAAGEHRVLLRVEPLGDEQVFAATGGQLFVAGLDHSAAGDQAEPALRIAAYDRSSGQRVWLSEEVRTLVTPNATQLLASPELIPVLVLGGEADQRSQPSLATLALRMVRKADGAVTRPEPIASYFSGGEAGECDAFLLATTTRIIVQANGMLAAFGSAQLEHAP